MPLYVFRCPSCDHCDEKLRSFEDMKMPAYCPNCSNLPGAHLVLMQRVHAASHFNLKGHGFHANDYGKSGPKAK
jgi:putative FmdB family regulatory protein